MKNVIIKLIIVGVLLVFGLNFIFVSRREMLSNTQNRHYAKALTNACVDGLQNATPGLTDVFNTPEKRETALAFFYDGLLRGLSTYTGEAEYIADNTPFVIMVDNDGFYISYNAGFDKFITEYRKADGTIISRDDIDKTTAITGLNTWSENVNGYIVRFFLNDQVQVITPSNEIYEGKRSEVYAKYPVLTCLSSEASFEEEKRYVIIGQIEDEINYLLNSQPVDVNSYYEAYVTTLSQLPKSDFARMMSTPCLISFYQGEVRVVRETTLNAYAYASSEVVKPKMFYTNGDLYYRYEDGITGDSYGTMTECAKAGATPDISAMWDN